MFFLLLIPALFTVNDADEGTWELVNAKDAYEKLNWEYNPKLKWDESLEKEALDWAKHPTGTKPHRFVKGKGVFPKGDKPPAEEAVRRSLGTNIKTKVNELKRFTLFGCNGVFNTTSKNYNVVSSVCFYTRN